MRGAPRDEGSAREHQRSAVVLGSRQLSQLKQVTVIVASDGLGELTVGLHMDRWSIGATHSLSCMVVSFSCVRKYDAEWWDTWGTVWQWV